MFAHFWACINETFCLLCNCQSISQIKYRVFKKKGVSKGAFQLSLCGYFCSVSLGELRVVSMTYQPSGTDGQLRHSPLLLPTVPLNCRHRYQWCPAKSFPPQHHCAPDPTEIPRDRGGCPVTAAGSLESTNISRGYCRGRTVSLQQNIEDKQSKSFKSPLRALWVEVIRLWFQMAPHIHIYGCTQLPPCLEWHCGCILKSA